MRDGGTTDLAGRDGAPSVDMSRAPDMSGCPGNPCDLVCQTCGAGRKCTLDANNALACMAAGGALPGQSCTFKNGDTCAAGSVCLTPGLGNAGACFRYCRTSSDCPGNGTCSIGVQGTSASVCTEAINGCTMAPAVAGCGAGTSCYPVTDTGQTGCHVGGTGGLGASCATSYDCEPGYACFTSPAGCQKVCRKGQNTDCPNGKTCTAVAAWTTAYGICM